MRNSMEDVLCCLITLENLILVQKNIPLNKNTNKRSSARNAT